LLSGCYPDAIFGIKIAAERRVAKIFGCLAAAVELLNRVCAAKSGLAAAVEMVSAGKPDLHPAKTVF
jgi:hypothetical protein